MENVGYCQRANIINIAEQVGVNDDRLARSFRTRSDSESA